MCSLYLEAFYGLGLLVLLYGAELMSFLWARYNPPHYTIKRSDGIDVISAVLLAGVIVALRGIRSLFCMTNALWAQAGALLVLVGEMVFTSLLVMGLCVLPGGDASRHREINETLVLWGCCMFILTISIFAFHTSLNWGCGLLLIISGIFIVTAKSMIPPNHLPPRSRSFVMRCYTLIASMANISLGILLLFM